MRIFVVTCLILLSITTGVRAQAPVDATADPRPIELGGGVVLPRDAYDKLTAREDGWAIIERMQQRAEDTRRFQGVPHLILIFVGVLVFFWSAMVYYQRKHVRLHQTIRLIVEKGLPLPAELLRAAEQAESGSEARKGAAPAWASNLTWGGILWITVGVTLVIWLGLRHSDAWPWGFAAIVYGAAAVATAYRKREAH
jgi:hypothetical protein